MDRPDFEGNVKGNGLGQSRINQKTDADEDVSGNGLEQQIPAVSVRTLEERINHANALAENELYEEARKVYEECVKISPQHFLALANFALLESDCLSEQFEGEGAAIVEGEDLALVEKEKQKAVDKAIDLYERALRVNDAWHDGHYNVANLYSDLGPEFENKALEHYDKALQSNPQDADLCNNYSICLLKAGKLHEALELQKKTVRLVKNHPPYLLNLAEIYHQLGDTKKALFFANKCMSYCKKGTVFDPQLLLLLAELNQREGKVTEANSFFQQLCQTERLELPARLRYFSLLMKSRAVDTALDVLKHALNIYRTKHPGDEIGQALLQAFCTGQKEHNPSLFDWQVPLSFAAEQILLHMRLDDPNQLAHKVLALETLMSHELSQVAPPSFISADPQEIYTFMSSIKDEKNSWYIKDPSVQRGQGIHVLVPPFTLGMVKEAMGIGNSASSSSSAGAASNNDKRFLVQQTVDPLLLDGRKFGVRMHVFVLEKEGKLAVFMCQDGILTKCGKAYDPADPSPLVQITCTSVQRNEANFDRNKVKGPASKLWNGFNERLPEIGQVVLQTVSACKDKLVFPHAMEISAPCRGQLFGYDFLFSRHNGAPIFIEANTSPQFQDAKNMESLRETVARPLINGLVHVFMLNDQLRTPKQSPLVPGGWKHLGTI